MLAHFGHHLLTALPIPLLPLIRNDFALDYTQSGLVVSAFSLAYGGSQLPAGWLADRISRRLLITIGICGVAVAGLLIGLSQTFTLLIIFLALMGIVGGGYHPSAAPLVSAAVEPQNQGRALGLHLIGGSASHFLAPLIAAAIAAAWGWRSSFIGLAVPTMIFGIVFYILLGRLTATAKPQQMVTGVQDETQSPSGRWRRLVAFMVLSTSTQAVTFSVIAFIPLLMVDNFGVSEETAAAFLSITYSAGLWAGPLGGYLSDRLGRIPIILAICVIAGPAIYLLNLAPNILSIGILLIILGMIIFMRMPVSEAYIIEHSPARHRSTILGIYYFSGMEVGAILAPVIGFLIDRFGFYSSFTIAGAVMLAITLISSVFLRGKRE